MPTTSGISAVEFSDAISNMNRAIDIMNSNLHTVLAIQDQYAAILTQYDNFQQDIQDLSACLNAYLKGTRSSFVDTSILYVNEIRPSEKSLSNCINITNRSGADSTGNIIYKSAVSIADGSVYVNTANINTTVTSKNYVIIADTSNCDQMFVHRTIDTYTRDASGTLDRMFDSSMDMVIKVRESVDNHNSIYIDPNSPIFNNNISRTCLQQLIDSSGNIDYVQMIPYIIAELQRMKKTY